MSQNFDAKSAVGDFKQGLNSLDFKSFFTTHTGRINRKPYLFYYVIPAIAVSIVVSIIGGILTAIFANPEGTSIVVLIVNLLVGILSIIVSLAGICPTIRRLHDLNYSGWLILLGLVPVVAIVLVILLCAKPGTVGANQYGEDPLKG
jgi:uncharacterized membrane protein YhaH (DUF805 family)